MDKQFENASGDKPAVERDENYIPLPNGLSSKDVVDIMHGRNTPFNDWNNQKDYSSEEGGLPNDYRLENIVTDTYVVAHMYNSFRNAEFTPEHSHGLIKLNIGLLVMVHNDKYEEPLMFMGGVDRLGLSMQDREATENMAASVLEKTLDSFGLKAIELDLNWIRQEYLGEIPSKVLKASEDVYGMD